MDLDLPIQVWIIGFGLGGMVFWIRSFDGQVWVVRSPLLIVTFQSFPDQPTQVSLAISSCARKDYRDGIRGGAIEALNNAPLHRVLELDRSDPCFFCRSLDRLVIHVVIARYGSVVSE